ncbi:Protein TKR [Cyphomyrmex costatus]|uniref:Protein TKR n=1 Tax=Cyphomyrmex costatus TaxID=456900 RepID=A0A195D593_9HYME|nr:Protein TKR [Cyphomyrmex costatus]
MSSVGDSPDRMALQSHYSLRWHNHLAHIQRAFEELLQAEMLVDVTLICADSSVKAHKVVLSACSPFFERIFAENPCKHPVIVLKDFSHHELSTLVHFIYRGEVQIAQEELPGLMKAAECLQVRGLSSSEPRPVSTEPRPLSLASTPTRDLILAESPTPEVARHGTPEEDENALESTAEMKPILLPPTRDHQAKSHIGHMNFGIRESCGSPSMPRRKQARPRRRSGELLPQDLSRRSTPPVSSSPLTSVLNLSGQHQAQQQQQLLLQQTHQWLPGHPQSQLPPPPAPSHHPREDSPHGSSRSHPYQQQQQQESALPRRSAMAMFTPTLDGVTALGGGLFSHHATTYDRGILADSLLTDNFKPEALQNLFGTPSLGPPPAKKAKKHRNDGDAPRRWTDHNTRALAVNRPKGQHSAPRGGPPRSWTNNELTLALQHVWEKKLTTSQASRMFGIPYNSLLMYVRGKYGKSLKLEQLRRTCTGTNNSEIMNNNNIKPVQQSAQMSHGLTGLPLQHPGDNSGYPHRGLLGGNMPQPQGFYPADYATASFPLVNMVHMLPPSEQKAFESSANPGGDGGGGGCIGSGGGDGSGNSGGGGDLTNSQTSETPSPIVDHHHHQESSMQPQPTQSTPALLQQNGSD